MRLGTKNRIEEYNRRLPRIKEKLYAAGAGLLIALVISGMATYAWITLSRAPEVSAIATTISANGALEIALSGDDGAAPSDADFDESVGLSTDVTKTNLQWGNLINIADSRYGIDSLSLRPAQLNAGSLNSSPLWGAVYGKDGRVERLDSKYTYTKWDVNQQKFLASTYRGVRAISSYTSEALDVVGPEYAIFESKYNDVLNAHQQVGATYYSGMTTNIGGLGNTISTYLQAKINTTSFATGDPNMPLSTNQLESVLNLYKAIRSAMEEENAALVKLANLQQYIFAKQNGKDGVDLAYSEVTWDTIKANQEKYDKTGQKHTTNPKTPEDAISISGLKAYIKDVNTADSDIQKIQGLVDKSNSGTTIYSKEIDGPVNNLVAPNAAELDGTTVSDLIPKLKANPFKYVSLLSGDHIVKLTDGIIKRFEQMASESRLPEDKTSKENAASVTASAKIVGDINVTGHLCTSATIPSYFMLDFGVLPTELTQTNKVAEDTYGMAVDFWIRSNHESTYLTLEGATTQDTSGNILSYDGKNRVWGATGNTALTTNSTTQGGGSCYIYYADTPEEMQRSLDLMRSLKVAFVSQDGKLLATAAMDTENYLAVNGRVTVPLVITTNNSASYTYIDADGEEKTGYAIKHLSLDEQVMITAIIYVDGETLDNTQVLSASDIEGQLNLQFGSSEKMTTVGDNKLLTAERSVTARVSKSEFNYDTDTNLTTTVTVEIDGTEPNTVEAFFVRAVNASQGKREEPIKFTRQTDGTWTGEYTFTLPGTYYLRYIRLDRVDYALEDPCVVKVTGFAIANVSWGEGAVNEKEYFTTDSSYTESVTATFVTTDGTRLPSTVQARFIRDDGNPVTIDLKTTDSGSTWTGTGTFTASGDYTLSYLLLNGQYYDISQFAKRLNLHMGLRAAVYNNNSTLFDEYDSSNPDKVYNKNVQVRITDSSNRTLTDLTDLKLYYVSGSNSVNGYDTNLTWGSYQMDANGNPVKDESGNPIWMNTGYYEGTLPLDKPGRFRFDRITVGTNEIRLVSESPTYVIAPPEAPKYDTSSASTYNGDNVNFIPLQANATMGPIRISNSAAVEASAVVYNSETEKYYDIVKADIQSQAGTMYYASDDGGYWMINLPTYEKDGTAIQDGTWQLVALKLWECFDGTTNEDNYRSESNPLVWVGNTPEAQDYASKNRLTADATIDFSKLATTVSCTVNVEMTSGDTKLGDKETPFMTQYPVSDLGMSIAVTDDAGRPIPASKMGQKGKVALKVKYTNNTDTSKYGYAVSADANRDYDIILQQAAYGTWQPDSNSNYIWQYVGEYKVEKLTVTVAGTVKEFAGGEHGVPKMYTITSEAPTADNLTISAVKQDATVFGMQDGVVTGEFLASYTPKVTVSMSFAPLDAEGKMFAIVPGMKVQVEYIYQDGNTAPNGGYSWTGTTTYERYTDTADSPKVSGSVYEFNLSGAKTLLAGRYTVTGKLFWTENGETQWKSLENLQDINAYSVIPTIEITGVTPGTNSPVTVNPEAKKNVPTGGTFAAVNSFAKDYAVVYMDYEPFNVNNNPGIASGVDKTMPTHSAEFANYTAPQITLSIANVGAKDALLLINNNGSAFSRVPVNGASAKTIDIGYVTENSEKFNELYEAAGSGLHGGSDKYADFYYKSETPHIIGTQEIDSIVSEVGSAVFTRSLTAPLFLRQENSEMSGYNVSCAAIEGVTVSGRPAGNKAVTNQTVTLTLTAAEGYHSPRLAEPEGVSNWTVISEGETEAQYSFTVRFSDVTLQGTSQKYPQLTWSNGSDKTTLSVRVNGEEKASGVRVKPGTEVTVTAVPAEGYYGAKVTTHTGVNAWKSATEGDLSSVYTFVMPDAAVTLKGSAPSKMYHVNWVDGDTTFTARYAPNGLAIAQNGYAIPGRTIRIAMNVTQGYNPQLVSPAGATYVDQGSTKFLKYYDFVMPAKDVTLAGTITPYDKVTFVGGDKVGFAVKDAGIDAVLSDDYTLGVAPDNMVTVTVYAKPGYYAPRLTSSDVTLTAVSGSLSNASATYTFQMPTKAVKLTATASDAPTITLVNTGADLTFTYRDYTDSAQDAAKTVSASGAKVQPGQTVTVTAQYKAGYYAPAVTAAGAALSARTPVGNGWDTATYTFTMGTENVTLTGTGTPDPLVKTNSTVATISANNTQVSAAGVQVHPGSQVKITALPKDHYYAPRCTAAVSGWTVESESDESASYHFTMGTAAVTVSATATQMWQLSWNIPNAAVSAFDETDAKFISASGTYLKQGHKIKLTVTPNAGYYMVAASAAAPANTTGWKSSLTSGYVAPDAVNTSEEYSFTMTGNVQANMSVIVYPTITITVSEKNWKAPWIPLLGRVGEKLSQWSLTGSTNGLNGTSSGTFKDSACPGKTLTLYADGTYNKRDLYRFVPQITSEDISIFPVTEKNSKKDKPATCTATFTMPAKNITVTIK